MANFPTRCNQCVTRDPRSEVEASGFEVKSGSECEKEGVEERDWNFVAVSGQSYDRPSKTLVHSDEASSRTGWLARLVFELDARLRRRLGLIEYTSDPDCIFRIELRRLDHPITLSDGTELLPGEEIVQLHFWNERMPRYDGAGANFQWARQFSRLFGHSFRELSSFLSRHDLKAVRGVRADVALGTSSIWIRFSDSVIITASGRCETPCRSQPARISIASARTFSSACSSWRTIAEHSAWTACGGAGPMCSCRAPSSMNVSVTGERRYDDWRGDGCRVPGAFDRRLSLRARRSGDDAVLRATRPAIASQVDPVTILKPLCGDEPHLYERLRSFCTQDFPAPVQVVLGVQISRTRRLDPQSGWPRHSRIG